MDPLVLAYYCSGHGYGHATRVSAFTRHLLSLSLDLNIHVHIVSSAPALVFSDSIALGAKYRHAEIDPVIVQPLAYRVDRAKSVEVLQHFLGQKERLVRQESCWLISINARAVLTDAAFLACLAADACSIPSVLLTNFSFDSVYSFLSTSLLDIPPPTSATSHHIPSLHHLPPSAPPSPAGLGLKDQHETNHQLINSLPPPPLSLPPPMESQEDDAPIPLEILRPLTQQLLDGYTHADLLVLLPGAIPIPSFSSPVNVSVDKVSGVHSPDICSNSRSTLKSIKAPALPSSEWVDPSTRRTVEDVERWMQAVASMPPLESTFLSSSIETTETGALSPFVKANAGFIVTEETQKQGRSERKRQIIHAPLIVRPPSGGSSSSSDHKTPRSQSIVPGPSQKKTWSPYTQEGRSALLASIGVPAHLHDHKTTRILVVSFGGQVFRCLPGSHGSSHASGSAHASFGGSGSATRMHSRRPSREISDVTRAQTVNGKAILTGDIDPTSSHGRNHATDKIEDFDDRKKSSKTRNMNIAKAIDVLKPLDPNSLDMLSNRNHEYNGNDRIELEGVDSSVFLSGNSDVGGGGSVVDMASAHQPPRQNAHADVKTSEPVPGVNNNVDGDIGMGVSMSILQTGTMDPLMSPVAGQGLGGTSVPAYPSLATTSSSSSPLARTHSPSPLTAPSSSRCCPSPPPRIATPCHIWIPGAPAPVPVPFSPATPSLLHRRRTIAVGSARVLRLSSAANQEDEKRRCKRSSSSSMSVTRSMSMSSATRIGGNRDGIGIGSAHAWFEVESEMAVVPSVVTTPPTPLSFDTPEFPAGQEKEKDNRARESPGSERCKSKAFNDCDDDVIDEGKKTRKQEAEEYTFFEDHTEEYNGTETDGGGLMPDGSWIAIVCGMSGKKNKEAEKDGTGKTEEAEDQDESLLPEGFYIAPRDVYMPDLMALADVLLGKLGYGTVSECVDACTPFIYVSRPLFIEEHGLRLLLDQQGVGVELSREAYEQGEWAMAVTEAWERGKDAKEEKRRREKEFLADPRLDGAEGPGNKRQKEGKQLAGKVVDWVRDWWGDGLGTAHDFMGMTISEPTRT